MNLPPSIGPELILRISPEAWIPLDEHSWYATPCLEVDMTLLAPLEVDMTLLAPSVDLRAPTPSRVIVCHLVVESEAKPPSWHAISSRASIKI